MLIELRGLSSDLTSYEDNKINITPMLYMRFLECVDRSGHLAEY